VVDYEQLVDRALDMSDVIEGKWDVHLCTRGALLTKGGYRIYLYSLLWC
jgi:hypothetical protein